MSEIKFRTKDGSAVRVVLLSGHCAIVGNEWRTLPEFMHQEAYALGCVSDNMEVNKEAKIVVDAGLIDKVQESAELKAKVRSAIEIAISENNLKAFTSSGNPTAKTITDFVGKSVEKHIRDAVWSEMLDEGIQPPAKDQLNNDIT